MLSPTLFVLIRKRWINPVKAKRITTNTLLILISACLTPSCHTLLALTRLHKELLIAITVTLTAVLPHGHPVRGVMLAELGKVPVIDELTRRPGLMWQETTPRYAQLLASALAGIARVGSSPSRSMSSSPTSTWSTIVAKERLPSSGPSHLKLTYEMLLLAPDEVTRQKTVADSSQARSEKRL
ncbi:uncharacterized protein LAESUDRAFT_757043 [Laetiporus sulphureus 93-53]|uniref:Uncharacterized protein n=1 Tax=Laetiporus sulphureus 93-53 TaxID=1314785 RepID=A0A165FEU0_9APHY|nr:uncharacterized protein LAESUDRAFT_757043 [Laetiporus sulphureus 93-53]KZT08862.1 hypothetical protein LAESUDRAFT_757043 [Laetiporus sulphureus 93-53]